MKGFPDHTYRFSCPRCAMLMAAETSVTLEQEIRIHQELCRAA